jgi:hypothetical protein
MSTMITPDGLTEAGKKFIAEKLGWIFTLEDIKSIQSVVDSLSRSTLLNRWIGTTISDAIKRSMPLMTSTSERISKALKNLFNTYIPESLDDMKEKITKIIGNPQ